jgi:hypothetical protein
VRVAHYDKILWGSELEIKFQGENSWFFVEKLIYIFNLSWGKSNH